jgi:hypothetical protein
VKRFFCQPNPDTAKRKTSFPLPGYNGNNFQESSASPDAIEKPMDRRVGAAG